MVRTPLENALASGAALSARAALRLTPAPSWADVHSASWIEQPREGISTRRMGFWVAAFAVHVGILIGFVHTVVVQKPIEPDSITVDMIPPPPPPQAPKIDLSVPVLQPLRLAVTRPIPNIPVPAPLPVPATPPETATPVQAQHQEAAPSIGVAAPPPDYIRALGAHLARYKRYPRAAQLARRGGIGTLRFVINRRGEVLSHDLVKSSGFTDLDQAIEDMLLRAQPLPPLPADMPDRMELIIPIEFAPR